MKRLLLMVMCILGLMSAAALAEGEFELTATVAAEESALLALPMEGSVELLPLTQGDALRITALGTAWCEAEVDGVAGYVAFADVAFDVLAGEAPRLAVIDVSPTNQYHGRITLRSEASVKSRGLRKLERGALVLLMEEQGDMIRVVLPDVTGFVQRKHIADVAPAESYRIAYVDPGVNAWLRLDSQYARHYMICRLEPGTPVQFISNPNGWAVVEAKGYRGRMLAHNLTFEEPEQ